VHRTSQFPSRVGGPTEGGGVGGAGGRAIPHAQLGQGLEHYIAAAGGPSFMIGLHQRHSKLLGTFQLFITLKYRGKRDLTSAAQKVVQPLTLLDYLPSFMVSPRFPAVSISAYSGCGLKSAFTRIKAGHLRLLACSYLLRVLNPR
jgi:hypothetical protein